MTAKYWQKGEVLDYKASAAVKNGEVVSLGTRIGVAGEDIAAGETGHLHVVGVFEMEKATRCHDHGRGGVLRRNRQEDHHRGLHWREFRQGEQHSGRGYAAAPAASADENVLVKLLG